MVLASAFILVSVLIVVILFEYLHWSYVVVVVVAFIGAISIIVAALVLDRLTHKNNALS
jgi:chromate transport protein ChrA